MPAETNDPYISKRVRATAWFRETKFLRREPIMPLPVLTPDKWGGGIKRKNMTVPKYRRKFVVDKRQSRGRGREILEEFRVNTILS